MKQTIAQLDPQLQPAFKTVINLPLKYGVVRWLLRNILMRFYTKPMRAKVEISRQILEQASLRIYSPNERLTDGAIIWIHGGGHVFGDAAMNDPECGELAEQLGCRVFSVDYRLSPEHPFPAALNDCFDAMTGNGLRQTVISWMFRHKR